METAVQKTPNPKNSASVHYLSENHAKEISKIPGIDRIAMGSPLVQITFSDSKGQISLLETRLEKSDSGYYLTSNGYSENSRNWPEKDMQIVRLDQLAIINKDEVAKINLLLNPQNLEQAFKLSAGSAIGIKVGYDCKEMFIFSVDKNGIINAVELSSAGPLTDSYYKINKNGELLRCDDGDEYSTGKIKAVYEINSKMRLDLKNQATPDIQVCSETGIPVGKIAAYELIQAGTEVKINYLKNGTGNETQSNAHWHGVQHGRAVISDKNSIHVELIPLEHITQIDNCGSSYNSKEDLAVYLTPKTEKAGTPGAYTVYTGAIGSSQMPFSSGDYLFTVPK